MISTVLLYCISRYALVGAGTEKSHMLLPDVISDSSEAPHQVTPEALSLVFAHFSEVIYDGLPCTSGHPVCLLEPS